MHSDAAFWNLKDADMLRSLCFVLLVTTVIISLLMENYRIPNLKEALDLRILLAIKNYC